MELTLISRRQMYWIVVCLETSSMLLLAIRSTVLISKQDSWMSMLVGGVIGLGITYIAVRLGMLFPEKTIVQYSELLLGKWLGKVFVIPYFAMAAVGLCITLRQLVDFIHLAWFEQTPLWVLVLGMLWLLVYITYAGGIEGIARCAELIGPLVLITVTFAIVIGWEDFQFGQLLPVYADSGWRTILNGSLSSASFFGQTIIMITMIAFMKEKDKAMMSAVLGLGTVVITLATAIFFIIAMFGPGLASEMLYPAYETTRFLSVMEFLQSIDAVIVIVWILGYFVQLSMYYFLVSYTLGEWLGVKRWRILVFIIAPLVFVGALWPQGFNFASIIFPRDIWMKYALPINMVGLPLFLLTVGLIRKPFLNSR